ncbi:cupin domain-containing protein [Campylobacter curvus]|uniref:cupin domain-containing protein n=1 Tax=Campylobacter curvus TaxID=200 RepID=UPI0003A05355|nr:cupin domain-containing protein [Campylobacter curvus]QKF60828.1 Cupin domain-containing protein [Campylobacter curvus]UEB49149.1 cupin domain-containing protein [Campylobacter curvus]
MSKIYNLNADTKVIAKSVVSKRIFDCENAHVDVFAFDAGEELDHEMLFCDSLAWVVEGEASLLYGERNFTLTDETACLIEKKVWRKLVFNKPTKYVSIDFKEDLMIEHLDKASVFSLVDAVAYEEGKIVSKTLVKNENGSMSLISFSKDQQLSTHAAPGDALLIALDGEMKLTIADEHFDIKKGDTIVLPGKIPHALKIADKFKMLLIVTKDKM